MDPLIKINCCVNGKLCIDLFLLRIVMLLMELQKYSEVTPSLRFYLSSIDLAYQWQFYYIAPSDKLSWFLKLDK